MGIGRVAAVVAAVGVVAAAGIGAFAWLHDGARARKIQKAVLRVVDRERVKTETYGDGGRWHADAGPITGYLLRRFGVTLPPLCEAARVKVFWVATKPAQAWPKCDGRANDCEQVVALEGLIDDVGRRSFQLWIDSSVRTTPKGTRTASYFCQNQDAQPCFCDDKRPAGSPNRWQAKI